MSRVEPGGAAGKRAETTLERWQQIHGLLATGTGLEEYARRLDLSLSTVKRYARAGQREAPASLATACPEMTALAGLVRSFAALLTLNPGNARHLQK